MRKRVLVVDDEPLLRRTLRDYLEDEGMTVTDVASAEEGLELLRAERFDACTVDLRLTGMNGDDFIRHAMALDPALSCVIYTGSLDYTLPVELRDLGLDESRLFHKPIEDVSVLVRTLFPDVERHAVEKQPAPNYAVEFEQGDGPLLLVIDDEPMLRLNISHFLEDLGYSTATAANGLEGLEIVRNRKPAAILVDLNMPEMDGFEVLEAVQRESPEIPVIVVSGVGIIEDAIRAVRLGAWDYLTKPIKDLAVLEHAVGKVIERARLLEENRRYRDHLESLVEERTEGLRQANAKLGEEIRERLQVEQELRRAMLQAERADRAKSEFLSNMTHELRTPLNGIMGMGQVLLETGITDEQKTYLEMLMQSSTRLLCIIDNLLDMSSLVVGDLRSAPFDFDLRHMVDTLCDSFLHHARLKGLDFAWNVDRSIPDLICSDERLLRQILSNLLENAFAFTSSGGVRIEIAPASDGRIAFSVKDTGVGIAEDKQAQIFDTFSLGEDFLTKERSGSGIGLSICREFVRLLGGEIGVCSTRGEGSTFRFTIRPDESTKASAPRPLAAAAAEDTRQRPLRILYAEDDIVNQTFVQMLLEDAGHRVDLVEDGRAALDAYGTSEYDLVLMDLQMPRMGGFEAVRQMRRTSDATPPIIALTAYDTDENRANAEAVGMDGYLTKPIAKDELFAALRRYSSPAAAQSPLSRSTDNVSK